MFIFGKNIQVCHIADLVTLYTDRLLAGLFFGVEFAGFQHVGATLVNRLRETPNLFLSAMLPEACRLASDGENDKLMELYRNSTRKLVTIIAPGSIAKVAGHIEGFKEGGVGSYQLAMLDFSARERVDALGITLDKTFTGLQAGKGSLFESDDWGHRIYGEPARGPAFIKKRCLRI